MRSPRNLLLVLTAALLVVTGLTACSAPSEAGDLHMMPMEGMPAEVQSAPVTVQTAYQFSAANPDIMKDIPCYCGCGSIGHTSNYDCYVSSVDASGTITYDSHALGCTLCVDITQDVMRMLREGKSPQEARAYIDSTYARYGPSNIP